jgi:hypothetical protein
MIGYRNAWDDPNVKAAMKQRPLEQVCLICCERCGNYGYYNEGSHFSCSVDGCDWSVSGGDLDRLINAGDVITLADYTEMAAGRGEGDDGEA